MARHFVLLFVLLVGSVSNVFGLNNELQYSMKRFYYSDNKRVLNYDFSGGTLYDLGGGVSQIYLDHDFQSGGNMLQFALNMNKDHFTLDTTGKALILKGTMESDPTCHTYACSAAGGMEYVDAIYSLTDAEARAATAFFHAVRLADFKAFSSEKYNAFTYGFQGNNLTGADDYPQARITAKWIKGFYCGRLFNGELVLEAQVFTKSSRLWAFTVADGGGTAIEGLTDPTTAVVDLAIEGEQGGGKVNFYYRTGGATANMSKSDNDWTLFATYQGAAVPFYGYPVNKGLLTLQASDLAYPPTVPTDNPINTGQAISVSVNTAVSASADDLNNQYRVIGFEPASNVKRIVYTCTPGAMTAVRASFSGMNKSPSQLNMVKLRPNGKTIPFGRYRRTFSNVVSGEWAITTTAGQFLAPDKTMTAGVEYYLYMFIQDNDGVYDLNQTLGTIEDPAVLGVGTPAIRPGGVIPMGLLLDNN